MWKIFSVPCGSALYKFHCTLNRRIEEGEISQEHGCDLQGTTAKLQALIN
jgi:hypothetical protein